MSTSSATTEPRSGSAFALPEALSAKATATLIAADEQFFARVAATLDTTVTDLTQRLATARRAPGTGGTAALERDQEVHRLTSQLRLMSRYGLDLCLGRMVGTDGSITYVGRLGLRDGDDPLLVDWRAPAAEPFFAATHAQPLGLRSRRRYRWSHDRVVDYWDEVFDPDALVDGAPLDDQSAFIASLGGARTPRMRDVLATIQSDQDAIIRADSRGALVVDGGPGTGKTVVALHRTAFQLYADPRLGHRHGGVLFLGPSPQYLDYVSDVLPSLGEEGVLTATLRDLVPEGATASREPDPQVRSLKAQAPLVHAIEAAVAHYERPPRAAVDVDTDWGEVRFTPSDWADAFGAVESGTPHNEAHPEIWEVLGEIAADQLGEDLLDEWGEPEVEPAEVVAALQEDEELVAALAEAWPMLQPTDLVAEWWSKPASLQRCAPWLTPGEVATLQRAEAYAWTDADLPLLDAARRRVGDPTAGRRARERARALADNRREMDLLIDQLIASDATEMQVMSMLRGEDLRGALDDPDVVAEAEPDRLLGPFAHVVVDEAQELTDAQWQMVLARCPSRSLTIVGDRAQARHGFTESWTERLERIGLDHITVSTLSVNYRTPAAIMAAAEPVIRAALPDANVPTSIRETGEPVQYAARADRDRLLADWATDHPAGIACVIGDPTYPGADRISSLTPEQAKGLEFDLVVLVDPPAVGDRIESAFGDGIEGAVDRYVAMTRATGRLAILT
ncbi:RNA polymerase recycling motor ATPase HelR [Granulicoccus phenolivorans]|uniref:RNA polymerase recycling motor ATPase HelR n=1 Tax=Granulicoccus phenolivorans TaxID=266854 RepID=UPI00040FC9C8|nr:RNA polymerase recycling motor ATPase HelR [Granulicoccus phenolivorans]